MPEIHRTPEEVRHVWKRHRNTNFDAHRCELCGTTTVLLNRVKYDVCPLLDRRKLYDRRRGQNNRCPQNP